MKCLCDLRGAGGKIITNAYPPLVPFPLLCPMSGTYKVKEDPGVCWAAQAWYSEHYLASPTSVTFPLSQQSLEYAIIIRVSTLTD